MGNGYHAWASTNVGSMNDAIESGRSDQIILVSEAFHEQNLSDTLHVRLQNQHRYVHGDLDRGTILLGQDNYFAQARSATACTGYFTIST